jgi:hypothetical protein
MSTNTNSTTVPFRKGQHVYCPHTGERGIVQGWSIEDRSGKQIIILGVRCSYASGDSLVTYTSDAWVSDEDESSAPVGSPNLTLNPNRSPRLSTRQSPTPRNTRAG